MLLLATVSQLSPLSLASLLPPELKIVWDLIADHKEQSKELAEAVTLLVTSIYTRFKLIVAHSSGEGFSIHCLDLLKHLKRVNSQFNSAKNFSDEEAKTFMETYGLCDIPETVIFKQTNKNPLLLHYIKGAKCRYWKDKYNMVFKAHLETTMRREIETLTTSTFTNLTEFSEIQAFSQ